LGIKNVWGSVKAIEFLFYSGVFLILDKLNYKTRVKIPLLQMSWNVDVI